MVGSFPNKTPPARRQDPLLIAVGAYVVVLSLFGGGAQVFGLASLLLMLATTIFVGAVLLSRPTLPKLPIAAHIGLAMIVVIPLLQIIPLPPGIWQALPGNSLRLSVLTLTGQAHNWQSLSLEPLYTIGVAVMAAGFVTLVVALISLSPEAFDIVLKLAVATIVAGIAVGVFQVTTHGAFPSFYEKADTEALIGFYSNKNHMALAVAVSIPLAFVALGQDRHKHPVRYAIFMGYWAVALTSIVATTSRAGIVLGLVASLPLALSMLHRIKMRQRVIIGIGLVVLAIAISASTPFQELLARFDYIDDDNRWLFVLRSLPLVREYWLAGAGGGVFADLFITAEPIEWVGPTFLNHVHNDYVELVIEYGVPGIVALFALVLGVAQAALDQYKAAGSSSKTYLLVGLLVVGLVAAHSLVDYPSRRPAILPLLALGMAMCLSQGIRKSHRVRGR